MSLQVGSHGAPSAPLVDSDRHDSTLDTYSVRQGDTMSAIAARLGIPLQLLVQANRQHVLNPDVIYPGQQLHIPRADVQGTGEPVADAGGQRITAPQANATPTTDSPAANRGQGAIGERAPRAATAPAPVRAAASGPASGYHLSQGGLDLIKGFEGLRLDAYQDSGGVWTIGYGHTSGVRPGQRITQAQADQFLREDSGWAQQAVRDMVKVPLTQKQFDALTSFTYNMGTGGFGNSSLLAKLNRGDYAGAQNEFRLYVHDSAGNRLEGLVRRRAAEAQLFGGSASGQHGNTYVVQSGDTLSGIAASHGTDWQTLARVNGISNPDTIYPGQVLTLPGKAPQPPAPAPAPAPAPGPRPPAPSVGSYTVRSGDTLSSIAQQFNTSWQQLARDNRIANPDVIQVGQVLKVPVGSAAKPAPGPSPASGNYTVRPGDTLSGIAQQFNTSWQQLARDNAISNPDIIQIGQVLRVPGRTHSSPPPAPAPRPAPTTGSYTVQPGDTLSGIAQQFNTSWQQLARDNGISNPDMIQIGQVLRVPGGNTPAPPAPNPNGGPNLDRRSWYLEQPGSWQCGPTSLTMALASWGVRPSNLATMNEMVRRTGANPNVGVPGNARLIADAARQVGMTAHFNPDGRANAVREALRRGHGVVLNGGLPGGGGHFIYVAGLDSNGNFIIGDPARPWLTTMNAQQLEAFSFANPGQHPNGFAEIWR